MTSPPRPACTSARDPSPAQQNLSGNSGSLYTITTDSVLSQAPLYKGEGGLGGYWKSWSTIKLHDR